MMNSSEAGSEALLKLATQARKNRRYQVAHNTLFQLEQSLLRHSSSISSTSTTTSSSKNNQNGVAFDYTQYAIFRAHLEKAAILWQQGEQDQAVSLAKVICVKVGSILSQQKSSNNKDSKTTSAAPSPSPSSEQQLLWKKTGLLYAEVFEIFRVIIM